MARPVRAKLTQCWGSTSATSAETLTSRRSSSSRSELPPRRTTSRHCARRMDSSRECCTRCLRPFAAINTNPDPSRLLVRVSFIEIYNEHVRDLLLPQPLKADQNLRLREATCGLWVTGATEVLVESVVQVMQLLHRGGKNRTTAAALSNAVWLLAEPCDLCRRGHPSSRGRRVQTLAVVPRGPRRI